MAIQMTAGSRPPAPYYGYLLNQYKGLQDLHRCRTAEQIKSLPAAVRPNRKGTWAYDTVHRRLREEILKRVFEENAQYLKANSGSLQKLQELDREMQGSLSTPLRKLVPSTTASFSCVAGQLPAAQPCHTPSAGAEVVKAAEMNGIGTTCGCDGMSSFAQETKQRYYSVDVEKADVSFWNEVVLQREDVPANATWASAPWLVSELYFYRRLAEIFSHFENGYDFFVKQKRASLAESTGLLLTYADALKRLRNDAIAKKKQIETHRALKEKVTARGGTIKTASSGEDSAKVQKEATENGNQKVEEEFLLSRMKDLRDALLASLNGNAADLSLWPVDSDKAASEPEETETDSSSKPDVDPKDTSHILCDDTARFVADILTERPHAHEPGRQQRGLQEEETATITQVVNGDPEVTTNGVNQNVLRGKKVAYVLLDNAGTELLSDLWLACNLIELDVVPKVVFLVKQYPVFVSDALSADIDYTIQWIQEKASSMHRPALKELAELWSSYMKDGTWSVMPHVYFSLPYEYSDMPADLHAELKEKAAFVISKGDANYRRILGFRKNNFQINRVNKVILSITYSCILSRHNSYIDRLFGYVSSREDYVMSDFNQRTRAPLMILAERNEVSEEDIQFS